jgi:hypothetical protein
MNMKGPEMRLGHTSSAFALAAAVTVLFSTVLACMKDVYRPLTSFMNGLAGHNWTTQGLADAILFMGLGFLFSSTRLAERIGANRMISILVGSVVVAGAGLLVWFAWC